MSEPRIVVGVRRALAELDAVDTVDGQAALHLARLVVENPGRAVSLLREVRAIVAAIRSLKAVAVTPNEDADGDATPDEPGEDALTAARRRREAKAAGLGGVPMGGVST